jgi:hypothetical protein
MQIYQSDIAQPNVVLSEVERWRIKWECEESTIPRNAISALQECNPLIYPNIHCLLQIMATLPVSTSTAERSFSTLRRLKSYIRNSMAEDRLTALGLLSIHRERQIKIDDVIDHLSLLPRRLEFIL